MLAVSVMMLCGAAMSAAAVGGGGGGGGAVIVEGHNGKSSFAVCVVEEGVSIPSNDHGLMANSCFSDLQTLLTHRLDDVSTNVTLVWRIVNPEEFHWTSQSACEILNSSCLGLVVALSSSSRTQSFQSWASKHVIPHVIGPQRVCAMTSLSEGDELTPLLGEHLLLQELLSFLGWTQVAVLVDSRSTDSSATADVVQKLSDVYMGTLVFRLFEHLPGHGDREVPSPDSAGSSSHARHVQDRMHLIKESHFKTFLVMASAPSVALILREAQKLALLSREHYWVIALPFSHCFHFMKEVKIKNANMLIVRPLSQEEEEEEEEEGMRNHPKACHRLASTCETVPAEPELSKMADALEALIRSAELAGLMAHAQNGSVNSSICENSLETRDRHSAVVKELEEYQRRQTRTLLDTQYSICSTDADSEEGVVNVGRWSQTSGLQLTEDELFRNTFRDFGYRTLTVGTQEAKPFVQKIGNTSMFEGFCIDILNELAGALKFHYVFVEPPDGEWGAPKDDNSGNWTGIVQQVLSKEVDFGIGPFTITSIREEVIDFTKPFMEDGVGILTKRPDADAQNMFKMFTPLTPQVWGAVAGAVLLVSLCLCAIERLSPFSARNLEQDRRLGLLGSLWLIYGSYMEQGGEPHPRSVSARFLVGSWWLFTILMTSTYTANLAAFLTVTIDESPINSLSELASSSHLKPLVKTGSNVMTLFQEAEGGVYHQIWKKMAGMPVVKSNQEAQGYVEEGSYAYMTDASQLEYIMLKDCHTYSVAKELFNTGGFGFVLRENSPYMDVINYNIMKMQEAGLMDKWRHRWWSSPDPCSFSDRTSTAKELDWPSLSGLFYIFLIVTAASVLLRVLEIWIHADKFWNFWNRLKSMLRRAISKENPDSVCCRCRWNSGSDNEHGCSDRQGSRGSSWKGNSVRATVAVSSSASLAFDGPYDEEDEGERNTNTGNFSSNNTRNTRGSRYNLRDTRGSEFRDFDSENQYWEPPLQMRSRQTLSS